MEELRIDLYISKMKNFLRELIADPITGKELIEVKNNETNFLSSGDTMYSITDDVPVLLSAEEIEISHSTLHTKLNSKFTSPPHSKAAASYFNYFEEHESAATNE